MLETDPEMIEISKTNVFKGKREQERNKRHKKDPLELLELKKYSI